MPCISNNQYPHLCSIFQSSKSAAYDYLSIGLPVGPTLGFGSNVSTFVKNVVYSVIFRTDNNIIDNHRSKLFSQFIGTVLSMTNVTCHTLFLSLLYIQKLGKKVELFGNDGSEFRIWITSIMIADSFLNDNAFTCESFAEISALPVTELVEMKMDFLELIGYDLHVREEDYAIWMQALEDHVMAHTRNRLGYNLLLNEALTFSIPYIFPVNRLI